MRPVEESDSQDICPGREEEGGITKELGFSCTVKTSNVTAIVHSPLQ